MGVWDVNDDDNDNEDGNEADDHVDDDRVSQAAEINHEFREISDKTVGNRVWSWETKYTHK